MEEAATPRATPPAGAPPNGANGRGPARVPPLEEYPQAAIPADQYPPMPGSTPASELPTERGHPRSEKGSEGGRSGAGVKTYSNAALQRLNYAALEAQMAAEDAKQVEDSNAAGEVPTRVDVRQRGYLQLDVFERR